MECKHEFKKLRDDGALINSIEYKCIKEDDKIMGIKCGKSWTHYHTPMEYCRKCGILRINPKFLLEMK